MGTGMVGTEPAASYGLGLNQDLCRFLDIVWSNRVSGPVTGPGLSRSIVRSEDGRANYKHYMRMIYDLYSRGSSIPTDQDLDQEYERFLRTVFALQPRPEIQTERGERLGNLLQSFFGGYWQGGSFCKLSGNGYADLLLVASGPAIRKMLSNTFYHCRLFPDAPVSYRVYLNVHPKFTAAVFGHLVAKWPTVFKAIVSNIKAAPPSRRLRADSVILYVDGPMAVEALGVFLTRYQAINRGHFAHGIPRMTKPLGDLVGVGYGAEPTRTLTIHGDGSASIRNEEGGSFGSLRSELIALALCATLNAGEDKRNFVRRVSQHLRAADIDPGAPWEQRA
jgi:hypothetical protein